MSGEACGFDGAMYTDSALLEALRSLEELWRQQLVAASTELRIRPDPGTWSAIEYAAHSRDVTALHAYRVERALMLSRSSRPSVTIWLRPLPWRTPTPIRMRLFRNLASPRSVSLDSPTTPASTRGLAV
jgi:hypothetical protein